MTRTGIQDDIILTRVVFNLLKIMWLLFLLKITYHSANLKLSACNYMNVQLVYFIH